MEVPKNAFDLAGYWTWMGEEGVARTRVKPNIEITIDHAIENTKTITSFYINKKFPVLVDTRGIKSISQEAREHFSGHGREAKASALGIIIKSPVSRVIGNFFLGVNKPAVPTRLFDNEDDALTWLKNHL